MMLSWGVGKHLNNSRLSRERLNNIFTILLYDISHLIFFSKKDDIILYLIVFVIKRVRKPYFIIG